MMKLNLAKTCGTLFLLLQAFTGTHAQETTASSGGEATGTNGSASYSVGQMVYTTITGPGGSLAQGVQQPYEISVITSTERASGISLQLSTYPNPVQNSLTLKIVGSESELFKLFYELYNVNGQLIEEGRVAALETSINMSHLQPSTYILNIRDEQQILKVFKIIKSK